MSERRTDDPTRPVVFRRSDMFYVVNVYEDDDFTKIAEHAALNPGTLAIEDAATGEVLWRRP
jgi:hypothetical protein